MRNQISPQQSKSRITPKPKSVNAIDNYFNTDKRIEESLISLKSLKEHQGWKIVNAYLSYSKDQLINALYSLDSDDPVKVQTELIKIQNQLRYIDYLLELPDLIIQSFKSGDTEHLDPYY